MSSNRRVEVRRGKRKTISSYQRSLLILTIPFMLFIIAFSYVPLLGWSMAFVKYIPGLSVFKSQFVGFASFQKIFSFSSEFPQALFNTLMLSFLGIACSPFPIVLAIAISELRFKKYQRFAQTLTSLPNFISWVIVFSLAFAFFAVDGGFVNNFLLKAGLIKNPTNLLGDKNAVYAFQTILGIWKYSGWTAIIYFGAIAGIDQGLYEAAQIDGAGRWKQILHVTVPGIMPTYVVMFLLSVGSLLSGTAFEQIYAFHNNLVHQTIQTLDYYVYVIGIKRSDFSFATAIGMFNSVVSVSLLFICNAVAKKATGRSVV